MSVSYPRHVFSNIVSDTHHFLRYPGLVAVTLALVFLLTLFIVYPIGSVLLKSFTVSFPTVTIQTQSAVSDGAETESKVYPDHHRRNQTPGRDRGDPSQDGGESFRDCDPA